MFAYVDETGNTGENVFDQNQPIFVTTAVLTKSDFDMVHAGRMKRLAKRLGVAELHACDLGIGRIEEIAGDLLKVLKTADARFYLSRVEKKYLVTTKVVDTLFDSGENLAVPWHAYNFRPLRLMLVFKIGHLLDEPLAREFWECLMAKKKAVALTRFISACDQLLQRLDRLPDPRSRQVIGEALTWARQNPEAIHFRSTDKFARYGHLPNMVAFTNLLDGIEKQSIAWDRPVRRIKHDRQMEFKKNLEFWHQLFSNAAADPLFLPGGERHVLRRVFGSEFTMATAETSAGIQATDVVMWIYKRALDGDALPPGVARIMGFVGRRARVQDFSFKGVSAALRERMDQMGAAPISDEQLERGHEFVALCEGKRQDAMAAFAAEKQASLAGSAS